MVTIEDYIALLRKAVQLPNAKKEALLKNIKSNYSQYGLVFNDESYTYPGKALPELVDSQRLAAYAAELVAYPGAIKNADGTFDTSLSEAWITPAAYALAVCRPAYVSPLLKQPPPAGGKPTGVTWMDYWLALLNDDWPKNFLKHYKKNNTILKKLIDTDLAGYGAGTDNYYNTKYLMVRFYGGSWQ